MCVREESPAPAGAPQARGREDCQHTPPETWWWALGDTGASVPSHQAPRTAVSHVPRGWLPILTWDTCEERSLRRRNRGHRDPVPGPRVPRKFCTISRSLHLTRALPGLLPRALRSPAHRVSGAPGVHLLPSSGCLCPHMGPRRVPSTGPRLASLQGRDSVREGLASGSDGKMNKRSVSLGLLPRDPQAPLPVS